MMGIKNNSLSTKPIFGIDIGSSSVKIMQLSNRPGSIKVKAYGSAPYRLDAVKSGMIMDLEHIASVIQKLINEQMVGQIDTDAVALSLPNQYCFNRILSIAADNSFNVESVVDLEIDKSIPMSRDLLYYDYSSRSSMDGSSVDVQIVACPRQIVESYSELVRLLGLQLAVLEPNISSSTRLVVSTEAMAVTTLIVDMGSKACDLSVNQFGNTIVTGTVNCSSDALNDLIAVALDVSPEQASSMKARYGLDPGKSREGILKAVEPEITKLVAEIKKVSRYVSDRSGAKDEIGQVVLLGGGANLPGLSTYLTEKLRMPVRLCAPWSRISFGKLQRPHDIESMMYTTAAGLALINQEDLE
jgi:type IV pilus assembly protein PilM